MKAHKCAYYIDKDGLCQCLALPGLDVCVVHLENSVHQYCVVRFCTRQPHTPLLCECHEREYRLAGPWTLPFWAVHRYNEQAERLADAERGHAHD